MSLVWILKKLLRDVPGIVLGVLVEVWMGSLLGSQAAERPWIEINADQVQVLLPPVGPSQPPPVVITQGDVTIPETATVSTRKCTDAQGREGDFQAVVFLASYNWVFKSTDRVEFKGQPTDITAVLQQQPLQHILTEAQQIIAVGTASCEASPFLWGPMIEERRAQERARQLVKWIEEAREKVPQNPAGSMLNVRALNLGRFQKECPPGNSPDTWNQRRIVLIAVTEVQKDLDLESCLQRRMKEDESLKSLVDNYSKFELAADWKPTVSP